VAAEIAVRGTATVVVPPDHAEITVTVEARSGRHLEAFHDAAERAAAVDAVLAAIPPEAATASTASLVVRPVTRWQDGEEVAVGWRAVQVTVVRISDLERVGELLAALTAAGAAVAGPRWGLAPGNPAADEARRLAAEDAWARAEAYAEALGIAIGAVAWVREPGVGTGGGLPVPSGGPVALRASASPPDGIDVTPAELDVEAAVEVGFTVEQ
jgi:uncharacterized protein YggE